jgi:hypothetical protein
MPEEENGNNTNESENTGGRNMPDDPKPEPKPIVRPGNGSIYCLLVGIDKYQNASKKMVKNLNGCVRDLDTIEEWLHDRFKIETKKRKTGFFGNLGSRIRESLLGFDGSENGQPTIYDITEIEGYNALHVLRLEDELATHQNIIDAFVGKDAFLKDVAEEDRVWFHYSGHGTEAPTAEEFKALGIGKDQCLMCHDFMEIASEKKMDGILADKEIAALLYKITNGNPKGAPHVIVTLDCCHSGGGTRDGEPGINERGTEPTFDVEAGTRDLASYFGNYQVVEGKQVAIPSSPHIVITACTNNQKASELKGGFFTNSLIGALKTVNGATNYADLQIRTKAVVRSMNANQTPTFNVFGGANAYTRFLEGTDEGDPQRFEVKKIGRDWYIALGAIHGIPATGSFEKAGTGVAERPLVKIFQFGDTTNQVIATAKLVANKVGPVYSAIELSEGSTLKGKDDNDDPITYFGVLDFLPAEQEFILLSGDAGKVDAFAQNHWEAWNDSAGNNIFEKDNVFYLKQPDPARPHDFEVEILDDEDFRIKNLVEGRTLGVDYGKEDEPVGSLRWDLLKVAHWKRLSTLENTHPESKLEDIINFKVVITGKDEQLVLPKHLELLNELEGVTVKEELKDITERFEDIDELEGIIAGLKDIQESQEDLEGLDDVINSLKAIRDQAYKKWIVEATADNGIEDLEIGDPEERYFELHPKVEIKGKLDKKHYFYLFKLHRYGVVTFPEYKKELEADDANKTVTFQDLDGSERIGWGLGGRTDENEPEERDIYYLKLIVTTTELDTTVLEQDPISLDSSRGGERRASKKGFEDWYASTIEIDLRRG